MSLHLRPVLLVAVSLFLAASAGFLLGQTLVIRASSVAFPLSQVPDTRSPMAMVTLARVRGGLVEGQVDGSARVIVNGQPIAVERNGSFRTALGGLPRATQRIAEGMAFVASSRGSKYYPVGSPSGERLSMANRIYFASEMDAEAAGYRR